MPGNKKEIRKQVLSVRNRMSAQEIAALSAEICRHIQSEDCFSKAQWIFAYHPLGKEVDIRPLIREAWGQNKQVAFPKVRGENMDFFEAKDLSELQTGSFGVMEPEGNGVPVTPQPGTLVLVPGVAFDLSGNRMGFGKGYYDRYLAKFSGYMALGVAYERQVADSIPAEETDIRMHALATEETVYVFS